MYVRHGKRSSYAPIRSEYRAVPTEAPTGEESVSPTSPFPKTALGDQPNGQGHTPEVKLDFEATAEEKQELKSDWNSYTFKERRIQMFASKALRVLDERSRVLISIEADSVYGAALAIPQIARTAGWSLPYTGLAVRSIIFLFVNVVLQGFLLYMLSKEERIMDQFGGQMYLCDFAAHLTSCPDGPNCVGPGGTAYSPGRLFDWDLWTTRIFVRDSLEKVFPDRAAEIHQQIDPGEYGIESYYLRMVCCFLFVLGMWQDLSGSWEIIALLYCVPTCADPWIEAPDPEGESEDYGADDALHLDFMKFQVAGMPLHWKIFDFFIIFIPKVYIWILTIDIGTVFLMETSVIEDMIINCVALGFILSIDELTMTILSPQSREMLENIDPYTLPVKRLSRTIAEDFYFNEEQKKWKAWSPRLFASIFPIRLVFMFLVCFFFMGTYYLEHCQRLEDGSWVAKELHLPRSESLPFLSFLLGPFPAVYPIGVQENAAWTYTDLRDHKRTPVAKSHAEAKNKPIPARTPTAKSEYAPPTSQPIQARSDDRAMPAAKSTPSVTPADMRNFFREADKDGSGTLSYKELKSHWQSGEASAVQVAEV